MNTHAKKKLNEEKEFHQVIEYCEKKSKERNCIFRGTSCACTQKDRGIQSTLYRQFNKINKIDPDKMNYFQIEEERIGKARYLFGAKAEDIKILTGLRHYGDELAIIDFTKNIFVALYFACRSTVTKNGKSLNEDGEINILQIPRFNKSINYYAEEFYAIEPVSNDLSKKRVDAQESIFVHAPKGFIDLNDKKVKHESMIIKKEIKEKILLYLRDEHKIYAEKMFEDLIGFIENKKHIDPIEYHQGIYLVEEENYEEGIKYFNKILKNNPESDSALNARGVTYLRMGKIENAIADFTNAIELNSTYDQAFYNRACAKCRKSNYRDAINDFNTLLEINPKHKRGYLERARIKLMKLEYNEVLEDVYKGLEIGFFCNEQAILIWEVMYNQCIVSEVDRKWKNRMQDECNKQKKLNQNIQNSLEEGFEKFKEYDFISAIEYFDSIIMKSKKPDCRFTYSLNYAFYYRGLSNINISENINGIKDLDIVLKTYNNDPITLFFRGLALYALGREEDCQNNNITAKKKYITALADLSKAIESVSQKKEKLVLNIIKPLLNLISESIKKIDK